MQKISEKSPGQAFHAHAFIVEPLESRQLLSAAPWSPQDQAIGLDQATQNYPLITGAGETVAIIDRGVDYLHPDLGGGVGPGFKIVATYNFQNNSPDVFPYDGDAHGTGTAGQIAANPHVVNGQLYQGVAPGVNLVALKTNGAADIQNALTWIINHRTQYNIVAVNYLDMTGSDETSFAPQLQALTDQGVFIGGAVGNYGPGPAYSSVNHLIALVGSVDANGQLSNFTPRGSAVDLVAPGGSVNIDWYANGQSINVNSDGTSWAGPQVVGAAALIKQVNPNFTPAQILSILRNSATQVWDSYSGMNYPELNVNAALGMAYQISGAGRTPAPTPTPKPIITAPAPKPAPTPIVTTPQRTPAPVSGAAGTPFLGKAYSTGQTIPAENFDRGSAGVSYFKPTLFNAANDLYRPGTVDMAWTRADGRTWTLGWTQPGEWLNYTIKIPAAGSYDLSARLSESGLGGAFHFEVDGVNVTGPISIPNTGNWNRYTTVTHKAVMLPAGVHVIRLVIDQGNASGFAANFNWFKFTAVPVPAARRRPTKAVNLRIQPERLSISHIQSRALAA